jgi:hypothetical protein
MEQQETKFKFPTETIELPSGGILYPEGHPLSSGTIEMKYMTAKEEDILTNLNYIKQGIVIDKLLQSLIVTKFNYDDLLIGDKNAIMVAARILGYGKDYSFMYNSEEITIDLSELSSSKLDTSITNKNVNAFNFTLPHSETNITYKYLTNKDEKDIDAEVKGLKRVNKNLSPELSTRLKYQIIAVEGDEDKKTIRDFVDNYMIARDSSALRAHIKANQPDVKMSFIYEGENGEEEVAIPIQVQFFWPDARI